MSIASISYSSINYASREAEAVAKKLDKYADSLYDNVYKKLNKYKGSWTSNLSTASSKIDAKISALRLENERYTDYAANLEDLRDECVSVDQAVKSDVSTLTASFKEAHGIRNSEVENAVCRVLTGLGNETAAGRWVKGVADDAVAEDKYLKDAIKEWYNYEGGKEVIKGVLVGVLEIAIAVLSIAGAILSGGALLVIIASVVAGFIALANGIMNIYNEKKAYEATQRGDPATGRRRSNIDSWQDYLRSSYAFGDDGEKYKYSPWRNNLAFGIDVVNTTCTVIILANFATDLLKNGYKWATGEKAKVSEIKLKEIFSNREEMISKGGGKLKEGFGEFKDIKTAFQYHNWTKIGEFGSKVLKDSMKNLKGNFLNFETSKDAVYSIRNMLAIPKDILSDKSIGEIVGKGFLAPGLTVFAVDNADTTGTITEENVTLYKITRIGDKYKDFKEGVEGLFSNDSAINRDVLEKLSTSCNMNISIPEINIPNIEMPVLRTA